MINSGLNPTTKFKYVLEGLFFYVGGLAQAALRAGLEQLAELGIEPWFPVPEFAQVGANLQASSSVF